jgi:plastocyanin
MVMLSGIAAGAAGASGSLTGPVALRSAGPVSAVTVSATAKQRAEAKAIRSCRRIGSKPRRQSCLARVRKRFASVAVPQQGPIAARIDVRDKYFSPALASIRTGQSILWTWNAVNADAHNVDLISPPAGVKRLDFSTPSSPSVGFEFRRTFKVPGTYGFVCSIHHNMTMTVEVSR